MNKSLNTKVLFLGADGVGKTTLLYLLKLDEVVITIPTIGFNVEEINYKERKITIFDIGGGSKIKYLWKHYMATTKCILYIMNISDKERFDYYIECFDVLLEQKKEYGNIPIIIYGNKFDDKIEFEPEELLLKSNLSPDISPHIIKGNIKKKEGLDELLEYIYDNIEFEEVEENVNEEKMENNNEEEENKPEKENYKVRMFGLDDSGKTKILYLLKLQEEVQTISTIGFNCEDINNPNWEKGISIWDVGGKEKIRPLWVHYFANSNGLIWVYDLSNKERYEESKNELKKILNSPDIGDNLPLLIYANKSDLNADGNKKEYFIEGIEDYLNNRPYYIVECNIYNIESYKEGLDWLYNNLNN